MGWIVQLKVKRNEMLSNLTYSMNSNYEGFGEDRLWRLNNWSTYQSFPIKILFKIRSQFGNMGRVLWDGLFKANLTLQKKLLQVPQSPTFQLGTLLMYLQPPKLLDKTSIFHFPLPINGTIVSLNATLQKPFQIILSSTCSLRFIDTLSQCSLRKKKY